MSLRIAFAGTPVFAAKALQAIVDAGFSVPLVLTRADKPKGRGLRLESAPVKAQAAARGLAILQPVTLRNGAEREQVLAYAVDVLVVAAYGLILPPDVLNWPRHGCLNIHASLLPRWRGAAPIQRAIEAGDPVSGVTIMQMDAGLDTGAMILKRDVPIDPRETAGSLHDKLALAGADAIIEVLHRLDRGSILEATPQPADEVTYAAKIAREDARIDWTSDAQAIDRRVRAFDPVPGAFTSLQGERIKIWAALPVARQQRAAPGVVLASGSTGIDVACGSAALRLLEVQAEGGKRMPVRSFLAGRSLAAGVRFDEPAAFREAGAAP